MYNSIDYSLAGIMTAYDIEDVMFEHPLLVKRRNLQAAGDFRIVRDAASSIIPHRKTAGFSIKESTETGTQGQYYKVNIEFELTNYSDADYTTVQQLRTAKVLILTHQGLTDTGNTALSVIRPTKDGWLYTEEGDDTLKVKLTITCPNGLQRVM